MIKNQNHIFFGRQHESDHFWFGAIFSVLRQLAQYNEHPEPQAALQVAWSAHSNSEKRRAIVAFAEVFEGERLKSRVSYRAFMKVATGPNCQAIRTISGSRSKRALHMKLRRTLESMEAIEKSYLALDRGTPGQDKQIRFVIVDWRKHKTEFLQIVGKQFARDLLSLGRLPMFKTSAERFVGEGFRRIHADISQPSLIYKWRSGRHTPTWQNISAMSIAIEAYVRKAIEWGMVDQLNPESKLLANFIRETES